MSPRAPSLRTCVVTASVLCLLCVSVASAEPPVHDTLKMRSLFRPTKQPSDKPARVEQAAPAVDPARVDQAARQAARVLALCYELTHKDDPSLPSTLTVQAKIYRDESIELRAQADALGSGYFTRCVERKLGGLEPVQALPASDETTRVIAVGTAK